MTSTNHALTGAWLVVFIKNPAIVLPLALTSHFLIDMVPHWNHQAPKQYRAFINKAELAVSALLIIGLVFTLDAPLWLLLAGIFLATAPDLMWLPEIWRNQPLVMNGPSLVHKLRRFHQKIQWSETSIGLFVELAWLVFMLMLFFYIAS